MNLFFWKPRPEPNCQGFRTQLESLTRELHLHLGEIHDATQSAELLRELTAIKSAYAGDLKELQLRTNDRSDSKPR